MSDNDTPSIPPAPQTSGTTTDPMIPSDAELLAATPIELRPALREYIREQDKKYPVESWSEANRQWARESRASSIQTQAKLLKSQAAGGRNSTIEPNPNDGRYVGPGRKWLADASVPDPYELRVIAEAVGNTPKAPLLRARADELEGQLGSIQLSALRLDHDKDQEPVCISYKKLREDPYTVAKLMKSCTNQGRVDWAKFATYVVAVPHCGPEQERLEAEADKAATAAWQEGDGTTGMIGGYAMLRVMQSMREYERERVHQENEEARRTSELREYCSAHGLPPDIGSIELDNRRRRALQERAALDGVKHRSVAAAREDAAAKAGKRVRA